MAFLNLNILPPTKKAKLEQLIKFLFAKNILEIVLLCCAILASAYIWGWLILSRVFTDLSESALLVNRDRWRYNQEIKTINQSIKNLDKASQDFVALTPKFLELVTSTPRDVRLTAVSIDRRQKNVIVSGVAKTRKALLAFEESLQHISWLQKTATPLSQLLTQADISFQFTADLKNFPPLHSIPTPARARPVSE